MRRTSRARYWADDVAGECGDRERDLSRRGRGDCSSSEWADPDIEFVAPHEEGPLRGVEAMRRSWREFLSAWKAFKSEPEEIIDVGEQVLVLEKPGGRGRGSGAPAEGLRSASLFTFRKGKVVGLAQYTDRAEALEAVGLRE